MSSKNPPVTLESLIQKIKTYYPDVPVETVERAYKVAEKAHSGQKRSSGDPYLIHPLEVAYILAELRLDTASIVTGLLHDTVEDTSVTLADIEKDFGKDVAELVDGVTKLSKITFKTSEEKQAENFRKMILAMSKDIRVILVKLSDRLNNMRTLEHLPPHKQKTIAQETIDIYAPIANRLGIGWVKQDLEDICLRYLHPDVYYRLAQQVSKTKKERENYIEDVSKDIQEKLEEYDIHATILGRAKHFFSIYKKMERRKVDFEEVYDVIAFRIIVDNITECYKSLGVIHAAYKPVPGRFKDYIAIPKANNYQSLHTTVIGPKGERVEIQIRTQEMHSIAESGIAAHWKYKEGRFDKTKQDNVDWVKRLLQWHEDLSDPNEFLETVKIDLFAEDVFVFTPKGEVKQLTYGSTPLDFAYAVHTDVGHRCTGAKVNGKIVPLKHRLKSGDTVEVMTSPNQNPSKDWLSIVKSSSAKAKIRAWIKQAERDRARVVGFDLLDKGMRAFGKPLNKIEKSGELMRFAQDHSMKNLEELYVQVGYGRFTPEEIARTILSKEDYEKALAALEPGKETSNQKFLKKILGAAKSVARRKNDSKTAITVSGLDDVLIRFGKCCNPLPGDSIVGFITRGRGVTVHAVNCQRSIDTDNTRKVDVLWNKDFVGTMKHHVKIRVVSNDEPGLLASMTQAISACGVNITSADIRTTKDKKAVCVFDVEVGDVSQLQKVASSLEGKKGVITVERLRA